ncbi:MAG: cyclic pyranopterin monophosphate synthase MoaC [Desulfurivibrionaceae bacterium]
MVEEETRHSPGFSHLDAEGSARMVDVGNKQDTNREAVATGSIVMSRQCFDLLTENNVPKGDVFGAARIAGIMASKKVDELIPLTHSLPISGSDISFKFDQERSAVEITASVKVTGKTGVEMEALTAVSIAALTVYDMCKSLDKKMIIENIRLLHKSGGKSGTFTRD